MVDIISRGETVNSNLYIQTLKILEKFFSGEFELTKILLKFSVNKSTHEHTEM